MSRLPSSRSSSGANPTARSSSAARNPRVLVQSPKSDIFVALLGIALGAILISCILMFVMLYRYNFSTKVSAVVPSASATALA